MTSFASNPTRKQPIKGLRFETIGGRYGVVIHQQSELIVLSLKHSPLLHGVGRFVESCEKYLQAIDWTQDALTLQAVVKMSEFTAACNKIRDTNCH